MKRGDVNYGKLFKWLLKPEINLMIVSAGHRSFIWARVAGKMVNERTSMQTTAVFACVRIIAETIASLPLHTYRYRVKEKKRCMTIPCTGFCMMNRIRK